MKNSNDFRFISMLGIFMACCFFMSGCNSDYDESVPFDSMEGAIDGEKVTACINGESIFSNCFLKFDDASIVNKSSYEYNMNMTLSSVYDAFVNFKDRRYVIDFKFQEIPVTIKGNVKDMSFEGETILSNNVQVKVNGVINNPQYSGLRKINANINYSYPDAPYVDNTYELTFDEKSIYPELNTPLFNEIECDGVKITYPDCINKFVNEINKTIVSQSGYNAAQIHFEKDGIMYVSLRDNKTGEFEKIESVFKYMPLSDGYIAFRCTHEFNSLINSWRSIEDVIYGSNQFCYFYGGEDGIWNIYKIVSTDDNHLKLAYVSGFDYINSWSFSGGMYYPYNPDYMPNESEISTIFLFMKNNMSPSVPDFDIYIDARKI